MKPTKPTTGNAQLRDDARLHYHIYNNSLSTELIVCHHGYQSSSQAWIDVAPLLCNGDHTVLLFDTRGAGESSDSPRSHMNFITFAQDVVNLVDYLWPGASRSFCFAGISMGCMVAMELCRAAPKRVRQLILVAPGPLQTGVRAGQEWHDEESEDRRRCRNEPNYFEKKISKYLVGNPRIMTTLANVTEKERQRATEYLNVCLNCSENHFHFMWEAMCNYRISAESLASIAAAHGVLLVAGGADDLLKDNMRDFVPMRKNCSLHVLPRVGHQVCRQVPKELCRSMLDFLQNGVVTSRMLNERRACL